MVRTLCILAFLLVARPALPAYSQETSEEAPVRSGFWFHAGVGYGTLGCGDCDERSNGYSAGLALGGALSPRFLVGIGTAGWHRSEQGISLTVGTLEARARFYPSRTGGFFVTGGAGLGNIRTELEDVGSNSTGFGGLLGLGYDLRLGRSISLTPFGNFFIVRTSSSDGNVDQVGVGVTVH